MKQRILVSILFLLSTKGISQQVQQQLDTVTLQGIEIKAIRAGELAPIAKTNLGKKEIQKNNIGQDLPFILEQTPSVQVNADAGNGIGYTGLRIRGVDATRINVTINGIPYNDAESQGTYFVDLPDIAASSGSIQIQRGIGSSTNGAGAFGGSIHINTNEMDTKKSIQFNNNTGSFQSLRNTLQYNSGLIKNQWMFTGRISQISSNGYVDRAVTRLGAVYTGMAWIHKKTALQLNVFSGKEKTYAAWFGINQATLDSNRRYNPAGTEKPGDPYDNETDNYIQSHVQFFWNQKINTQWKSSMALFLTKGKGYYEQYKANQSFADYSLPNIFNGTDSVYTSDLIRQLWLDNYFYGSVFSLQYNQANTHIILGGSITNYDGHHFGEVIQSIVQLAPKSTHRWYNLFADKNDYSVYAKWTQQLNKHWQTYIDIQLRKVDYRIGGFRNNPQLLVSNQYAFFNPKIGATYTNGRNQFFFSYSKASKEPNRDDFEAGTFQQPLPETLHDIEIGFNQHDPKGNWSLNVYGMFYKNQLVLSGKINDVFAYTRTNIKNSYRVGIEWQGNKKILPIFELKGNLTVSSNKVLNFTEYIDNYDNGIQASVFHKKADISFSPAVIAAGSLVFKPCRHIELSLIHKYVSDQYLDNTSNNQRKLRGYFTQHARIEYAGQNKKNQSVSLFVQANNIWSTRYESNGYTFSYIYGGYFTTENYYYPMALFHLMAGVGIKL